jgi:hypothetical protein
MRCSTPFSMLASQPLQAARRTLASIFRASRFVQLFDFHTRRPEARRFRVGQARLELATPRLSSACSNQLSYWPADLRIGRSRPNSARVDRSGIDRNGPSEDWSTLQKGGDPTAGSPTVTLLRLHPSYQSLFRRLPHEVGAPTSRATDSHGVTGGVYKARERIHRSVLICDY